MGGTWDSYDNASWSASALFAIIWVVPIFLETITSGGHIAIYLFTLVLNCVKAVTVVVYNDAVLKNYGDPATLYRVYKIFDWLVFTLGDVALYNRKKRLSADYWGIPLIMGYKYTLDEMVLTVNIIAMACGKLACLIGVAGDCWTIEGNFVLASSCITVLYFDLYVMYKIYLIAGKGKDMSVKNLVRLGVPVIWTFQLMVLLTVGSITYQSSVANFYSNALWNMASVIYPIVCLQSRLTSNAAIFLIEAKQSKKIGSQMKKSIKKASIKEES